VVDLDRATALAAARFRSITASRSDSIMLATAQRSGAILWTQDVEFRGLPAGAVFASDEQPKREGLSMNPEEVARLIRAGLPGAQVRVQSDDNNPFCCARRRGEFAQLKSVARHQLVYARWASSWVARYTPVDRGPDAGRVGAR